MLNKLLRTAVYLIAMYWTIGFGFAMWHIRDLSGQAGMIATGMLSIVIILLAIYEAVRTKTPLG